MRQALTFLATIGTDDRGMKTLAVISILALLTISGAAFTDQLLTNHRQTVQEANWIRPFEILWGTITMLSVDQFLRLISLPAVVVAFLVASQISGAGIFRPAQVQIASE
jgi:hypothetical protein